MEFSFYRYRLKFKHPLHLAQGSRVETPVMFLQLSYNGYTGYGEAVLPPYRSTRYNDVINYFKKHIDKEHSPEEILNNLSDPEICPEGRAAVEMAAYDILGQEYGLPLYKYFGHPGNIHAPPSVTLSPHLPQELNYLIPEFDKTFKQFKIKLGLTYDRAVIKRFRTLCNNPFWVDVNGGWQDAYYALDMIHYLQEKGALFVEQPMNDLKGLRWLCQKSPLPVIVDECFQQKEDLKKLEELCHGVNVKLMKCGGLVEAREIIEKAREKNLKLLMGCMSGSSCAVTAAAHLAGKADWVDLDGPFLIKNDPFNGIKVQEGKIILPDRSGLGLQTNSYFREDDK